jgi:hypothetical protein
MSAVALVVTPNPARGDSGEPASTLPWTRQAVAVVNA